MTAQTAKAKAQTFLKNQYPQAKYRWTLRLQKVTHPTGFTEYAGRVELTAPGYATKEMLVYVNNNSVMTR
jgi:hypothetical protein